MNRATVLIVDEFRMVSKDIIDTILKKFLTQVRMPPYTELSAKERKKEYMKEENQSLYLSSAFFVDHWSYLKCVDTCKAMLDDNKRQFVCGLPYELSIYEGLLRESTVMDEMFDSDFNELKFKMEYEALWYGNTGNSFFDYNSIAKNRHLKYPMLPNSLSSKVRGDALTIPTKKAGEIRIMSADIALMSSKKHDNDATAIFINQLLPTKAERFSNNIVYADTCEGLRTDNQALYIRKLFDEFCCDYIVLDTQGLGLGVYDYLAREITDPNTGEIYPALSCCNDAEMASRCTDPYAQKAIWSIKASAKFNSQCALLLREAFISGRIRLLISEFDGEELLSQLKGYSSLTPADRARLSLPYLQTTLLIDELTKLKHEEQNGNIRVYERAGMRKDRYSSLAYNYYVSTQIENEINKRRSRSVGADNFFIIRAPSKGGKDVNRNHGRNSRRW